MISDEALDAEAESRKQALIASAQNARTAIASKAAAFRAAMTTPPAQTSEAQDAEQEAPSTLAQTDQGELIGGTIPSGTATLRVSNVAQPLVQAGGSSVIIAHSLMVSTPSGNSGTVYLGSVGVTSTTGQPLAKGTTPLVLVGPLNLGALWIVGTAGDTITYLAT